MIMIDRSKRLSEPLHWGRREKAAVATVLACAALAVLALGVFALTSGSRGRADCVEVTFASTVGGATLHACGKQARAVCAASRDFKGIADALRAACRHAGYPFGARS